MVKDNKSTLMGKLWWGSICIVVFFATDFLMKSKFTKRNGCLVFTWRNIKG